MQQEPRVFTPKRRIFLDGLLFLNGGLVILALLRPEGFSEISLWVVVFNLAWIFFWMVLVTTFTKVQIKDNVIIGRSPSLAKVEIPLRKVHHIKTTASLSGIKRKFFKDIWSVDGKRIRLQRKFIGETQVNEIMLAIEKYPFREKIPEERAAPQS